MSVRKAKSHGERSDGAPAAPVVGRLALGMTPQDLAKKHRVPLSQITRQLKEGVQVELEHTTSRDVALHIAMDHVFEDPRYYSKLAVVEELGKRGLARGPQWRMSNGGFLVWTRKPAQ